MRRLSVAICLAAAALLGCPDKTTPAGGKRAEVKRLTGTTVEILPGAGQLPYCLVFTISEKGVIRQLTMTHANRSVKCEAGKPIGGVTYRIPLDEGKVRAHVFFSDQELVAGSVAQQMLEVRDNPSWSQLDLRLPGQVSMEIVEFVPEAEAAPAVGAVIDGVDAGAAPPSAPPDAGAAPPSAPPDAG